MHKSLYFAAACCVSPAVSFATCWSQASAMYSVEAALLKAIAWQESRGQPSAVGPLLRDGNRALGLMQINTVHLPALAKFGIRRENLFDACVSQRVGAWVLADCIKRFGARWKAVGCYYTGPHSKNTAAQVKYVRDVQRHYAGYRLQQDNRQRLANQPIDASVATASTRH